MDDSLVFEMQRLYPQIYHACHVDHVRPASTEFELSSHDSAILAHLDVDAAVSPGALAEHLGAVPSAGRVRVLLEKLSPDERAAAMHGLSLLATAARRNEGDTQ